MGTMNPMMNQNPQIQQQQDQQMNSMQQNIQPVRNYRFTLKAQKYFYLIAWQETKISALGKT